MLEREVRVPKAIATMANLSGALVSFLFSKKREKRNRGSFVATMEVVNRLSGEKSLLKLNNRKEFNNQNAVYTGGMGAGKTVSIKTHILSYIDLGTKFLIVDPKSDYSGESDGEKFAKTVGAKTYIIGRESLPVNPMYSKKYDTRTIRDIKYFISDLLGAIYPTMGGNQRGELRNAIEAVIKDCQADGEIPSLKLLRDYMFENGVGGAWVSDIIDPLIDYEVFSDDEVSFDDVMKRGESVVFNTEQLSEDLQVVVSLTMAQYLKKYMLKIGKAKSKTDIQKMKWFLVVDEASGLVRAKSEEFRGYLQKCREYGFGIILGFQAYQDMVNAKGIQWNVVVDLVMRGKNKTDEVTKGFGIGEFLLNDNEHIKMIARKEAL